MRVPYEGIVSKRLGSPLPMPAWGPATETGFPRVSRGGGLYSTGRARCHQSSGRRSLNVGRRPGLCAHALYTARVKLGHPGNVRCMTDLPPKAEVALRPRYVA